ncbi:MAG TPA: GNAT family N-acetyltransferase [Pirellulales bacterium]|nr:GNAT family N-acetyltransferase [Pirellulales bacterium]
MPHGNEMFLTMASKNYPAVRRPTPSAAMLTPIDETSRLDAVHPADNGLDPWQLTRSDIDDIERDLDSDFPPIEDLRRYRLPRPRQRCFDRSNMEFKLFNESHLDEAHSFDCGPEPYSKPLSDWIKAPVSNPQSALHSIRHRETTVWLYYTEGGDLAGYGSLAPARSSLAPRSGLWTDVAVIPMLALQFELRGKPDGPKEMRCSRQIMRHLIEEAARLARQYIVLVVDRRNFRAHGLYREFGFKAFRATYHGDYEYIKMRRKIIRSARSSISPALSRSSMRAPPRSICHSAMRVPVEPGQLRTASGLGRTINVRVLSSFPRPPDSWLCQDEATHYYWVLHESEIGELVGPSGSDDRGLEAGR